MRLSLEIPTAYLEHWSPLCDLDFVLAHRVLDDPVYAQYYRDRPEGRELILDNSMHELKTPLTVKQLSEAVRRCSATYVVSPDKLQNPEFCLYMFREMKIQSWPCKIAVTMSGRTPDERSTYLREVWDADMICMPYREPRLDWCREQWTYLAHWHRMHLFGVSELKELEKWKAIKSWQLSVDTAKPVKWGIERMHLDQASTLRNAPTGSAELLDVRDLTCTQHQCVLWNIGYLRRFL